MFSHFFDSFVEYVKDGLKHMRVKFYIQGSEPGKQGTVHLEVKEVSVMAGPVTECTAAENTGKKNDTSKYFLFSRTQKVANMNFDTYL